MAKKENKLTYLQMPLPESGKAYKMTKRSWSGLNKRQTIDTGALSMEENISTLEAPYLTPSQEWKAVSKVSYEASDGKFPISMFGFDDFLIVIYRIGATIKVDYITIDENGYSTTYTGTLVDDVEEVEKFASLKGMGSDNINPSAYYWCVEKQEFYVYKTDWEIIKPASSVVQFNVYKLSEDIVHGEYEKKLLIFPDKKSMDFKITTGDFTISDMHDDVLVKTFEPWEKVETDKDGTATSVMVSTPPETASHNYYYQNAETKKMYRWVDDESDSENSGWEEMNSPLTYPDIKYATVHLSRLFGVSNDCVYASGFNDYTNWNLDSVDEYNESNAWCSQAQSNTKAGGVFTGITTFQNHVVCFKRDFMHEIYNTKNPFRIQDIYAEGTIDNRTIQDVDGSLIFVSEDDVKVYTGGNPRVIGYYLNMSKYVEAVSGTDGRNYYLYCEGIEDYEEVKRLFVYDTLVGQWSEQRVENTVLNFAHNKTGMYALCSDGHIYQLDTADYGHEWRFETDLITNETVDIKHIKKIQMLADIGENTNIKVYMLYDDEQFSENSHLVYESPEGETGRRAIRVKPRQTAHYGIKLHVEGKGYAKLYELELVMQAGGDLYV